MGFLFSSQELWFFFSSWSRVRDSNDAVSVCLSFHGQFVCSFVFGVFCLFGRDLTRGFG